MMKRQVQLALPQGLQESVIALGWGAFYKIVGIIGLVELATTELLLQLCMRHLCLPWGWAGMLNTR